MYYSMKKYKLFGYRKSRTKHKMYDAILINNGKKNIVPFGDKRYENYRDETGLNLYPHLIHNDKERRKRFRTRHKHYLKKGFYSPSYFSYYILW
jgi:hypothetical protein